MKRDHVTLEPQVRELAQQRVALVSAPIPVLSERKNTGTTGALSAGPAARTFGVTLSSSCEDDPAGEPGERTWRSSPTIPGSPVPSASPVVPAQRRLLAPYRTRATAPASCAPPGWT